MTVLPVSGICERLDVWLPLRDDRAPAFARDVILRTYLRFGRLQPEHLANASLRRTGAAVRLSYRLPHQRHLAYHRTPLVASSISIYLYMAFSCCRGGVLAATLKTGQAYDASRAPSPRFHLFSSAPALAFLA